MQKMILITMALLSTLGLSLGVFSSTAVASGYYYSRICEPVGFDSHLIYAKTWVHKGRPSFDHNSRHNRWTRPVAYGSKSPLLTLKLKYFTFDGKYKRTYQHPYYAWHHTSKKHRIHVVWSANERFGFDYTDSCNMYVT